MEALVDRAASGSRFCDHGRLPCRGKPAPSGAAEAGGAWRTRSYGLAERSKFDQAAGLSRFASARGGKLESGRNGTAVIIPDYAVRMAILDFEELPAGESERAALVRFRLRKSVPFPIDEAQVSYSIQSSEPERIEVLVVAIARPILEEYESVFTLAGYRVGLVTPSSLAALPLCQGGEDGFTVLAKAAELTLTVLLLDRGRVRLVRCIDLAGEVEAGRQSSQVTLASLQQTVAYAEDQFSQRVKQLVLCGFGVETDAVGQIVEHELRIPYQAARSRFGWPSRQNAGLMGLLEQYAA